METIKEESASATPVQCTLDMNHLLMKKYQESLKERLLSALQDTDDQIYELNNAVAAQDEVNNDIAQRGYDLQLQLKALEKKIDELTLQKDKEIKTKEEITEKLEEVKSNVQSLEEQLSLNLKTDSDLQEELESHALEILQLMQVKDNTFSDKQNIKGISEKISKENRIIEIEESRQEYLVSKWEEEKRKLGDKIQFYTAHANIKKEEAESLRSELILASSEIESLKSEKQKIVTEWNQALSALEKQNCTLSDVRKSASEFEAKTHTLKMDVAACKGKAIEELEKNEYLLHELKSKQSLIAQTDKNIDELKAKCVDLEDNIEVLERTAEMNSQEIFIMSTENLDKKKRLDKIRLGLASLSAQKYKLENKFLEELHKKMAATRESQNLEKKIKNTRNNIKVANDILARKESKYDSLLLKCSRAKESLTAIEETLSELELEIGSKEDLLFKTGAEVLKTRDLINARTSENDAIISKLTELIEKAGGEEWSPYVQEVHNIRKETENTLNQKLSVEEEYMRVQKELFTLMRDKVMRNEENQFFEKHYAEFERKRIKIEGDIAKEENNIKDAQSRIDIIRTDINNISKIAYERKELHENLLHSIEIMRQHGLRTLQDTELEYLQKEEELKTLQEAKKKQLRKLFEIQKQLVYWKGKMQLLNDVKKFLKSKEYADKVAAVESEIKRIKLEIEDLKRQQNALSERLNKSLDCYLRYYGEAEKLAKVGKPKTKPCAEYIKSKIKHMKKEIQDDQKQLVNLSNQLDLMRETKLEISHSCQNEEVQIKERSEYLSSLKEEIEKMEQEKRQAILKLSFKQKKAQFLEKILKGTYAVAVRNPEKRKIEIEKLNLSLEEINRISKAVESEFPNLKPSLRRSQEYIDVVENI